LTKYPQPSGQRPSKIKFDAAAFALTMMFAAFLSFLIILPSIKTKATGFDENLKHATRFSYMNGVVVYVGNLVQVLLIVIIMFVIFFVFDVFGCISICYPFFLTFLFVTAMMSFSFLLRATFESSKF
jgi:uncharacterized Tic20 family protein